MSLLGERLRQERENRGLALLQIELDTRIRANLIQALEEGNLNNLPPEPFLRGLLRTYANYLRIDPKELLDLYVADISPAPLPGVKPLIIQRPSAAPHPPATRPEVEQHPPSRSFSTTPSPSTPALGLSSESSGTIARPPTLPETPLPRTEHDAPRSSSFAESMKALRRRLPLAPPSAKPSMPALRPANSEPPPSVPPELLPPPEYIEPSPQSVPEPEPTLGVSVEISQEPEDKSASVPEPEPAAVPTFESAPNVQEQEEKPLDQPQESQAPSIEAVAESAEPVDEGVIEQPEDAAEPIPEPTAEQATEPPKQAETEAEEPIPTPPPYAGDGHEEPIGQEIPVWVHVEPQIEKASVADADGQEKAAARRKKMKTMRFVLTGIGALVVLTIAAVIFLLVGNILPNVSSIATVPPTATPALTETTLPSPTMIGAVPTGILTLDATAVPYTPMALIPTQAPTVRSTTAIQPGTTGGVLNLAIEATQPITAQIGIDGAMAFNGTVAPGTSVSYSAKESLYIRVENLPGGTITFNGRKQVALNFGERSVFERQWNASAAGKITAVNPIPPSPAKATTPIPIVNPLPSPTVAPTRTPTLTAPSPSPTETAKPTSSPTPGGTPTRTGPTPTQTPF